MTDIALPVVPSATCISLKSMKNNMNTIQPSLQERNLKKQQRVWKAILASGLDLDAPYSEQGKAILWNSVLNPASFPLDADLAVKWVTALADKSCSLPAPSNDQSPITWGVRTTCAADAVRGVLSKKVRLLNALIEQSAESDAPLVKENQKQIPPLFAALESALTQAMDGLLWEQSFSLKTQSGAMLWPSNSLDESPNATQEDAQELLRLLDVLAAIAVSTHR
jgi:hypothetical protein